MIGMVATLTALLTAFSDMGLSWATIQRKHLSGTQVSNLFWINAGAGAASLGCLRSCGTGLWLPSIDETGIAAHRDSRHRRDVLPEWSRCSAVCGDADELIGFRRVALG